MKQGHHREWGGPFFFISPVLYELFSGSFARQASFTRFFSPGFR